MVKDLKTQGEILHPGEPELIAEKERRASGIPIDDEAFADMIAWSEKLGVPPVV
jgi:LDH2 family malate/lactate/ureidoglycolate dehydrogenase